MAYEPIPQIGPAMAAVSMMVMAESLDDSVPAEQKQKGHAALMALKAAWPEQYELSRTRVQFVPSEGSSVRAMYVAD